MMFVFEDSYPQEYKIDTSKHIYISFSKHIYKPLNTIIQYFLDLIRYIICVLFHWNGIIIIGHVNISHYSVMFIYIYKIPWT